jgi:MerR family transcriptional regulator, light-induced transcriptional regulator
MSQSETFAAELLEISATGYAALAAERLLAAHPELGALCAGCAGGLESGARSAHRRARDRPAPRRAGAVRGPRDLGPPGLRGPRGAGGRPAGQPGGRSATCSPRSCPRAARVRRGARGGAANSTARIAERLRIDPGTPTGRLALEYLATVLEGDSRKATDRVLGAVDAGLSVESAYLDVLVPGAARSGPPLARGRARHRRGARRHLHDRAPHGAAGAPRRRAPANGRTVICAAVVGNAHDIAVRVLADFFDISGWRSRAPRRQRAGAELASALQYFDGDLLVLSAALSVQLPKVAEAIAAVRRIEGRRCASWSAAWRSATRRRSGASSARTATRRCAVRPSALAGELIGA